MYSELKDDDILSCLLNIKTFFKNIDETELYGKKEIIDKVLKILAETNELNSLKNKRTNIESLIQDLSLDTDVNPENINKKTNYEKLIRKIDNLPILINTMKEYRDDFKSTNLSKYNILNNLIFKLRIWIETLQFLK